MITTSARPVGELLRDWRQRRHMSQLDLAVEAEISTKHLSFVETGRSAPSREMLLHLAELLEVPLRERNGLLLAAGYAPIYRERPLDDPALAAARRAVDLVLEGHEPFPAFLVDRHWTLVAANRPAQSMMAAADASLLTPPVNVLRLTLHPQGVAPAILNFTEIRTHLLARLRRQIAATADPILRELLLELLALPARSDDAAPTHDYGDVVVPLRLQTPAGVLSLFGTVTVFGAPMDVTLSELALEAFYPADAATAEILRSMARAA
jgi:transcriptional regulator with XRE-family HTH domain